MKLLSMRRQAVRPQSRHPLGRPQRGVALIEALVSILIFSFGVLGLIGLEASAVNFSVDAEDRNRASMFASEIASTMWLNATVSVTGTLATQYAAWQANISNTALPTGLPNGNLVITQTAGTTNSADITITWVPQTDKTATTRTLTTRVILP